MLEHYLPACFFHWFEKICQIPRISFHEEKIADFLEDFAKERGFAYVRDASNNILMEVPASEGYEAVPSFLLQSHMDMVEAKEDGVAFDFLREPIRLRVEGNELHGCGTNIGMDNGGGMAAMLAIADDPALPHPAMELLFTVEEEVGMLGVRRFDMSRIRSRRMINFDSGRTHNLCVSSAGAAKYLIRTPLPTKDRPGAVLRLRISGGMGGHGGLDIHKHRADAANVLGELLFLLSKETPVCLAALQTQKTVLSQHAEAAIVLSPEAADRASQQVRQFFAGISRRYARTDPQLQCEVSLSDGCLPALSPEDTHRVIGLIYLLRTGDKMRDADDPSVVLASGGITNAAFEDGILDYGYTVRAVEDGDRDLYAAITEEQFRLLGFSQTDQDSYGGWPMRKDSRLVALFDRKHKECFGCLPGHQFVHGGIETGVIVAAVEGMDAIAVNVPMANAHTARELLYLDQMPDFWQLITAVLADKDEE